MAILRKHWETTKKNIIKKSLITQHLAYFNFCLYFILTNHSFTNLINENPIQIFIKKRRTGYVADLPKQIGKMDIGQFQLIVYNTQILQC